MRVKTFRVSSSFLLDIMKEGVIGNGFTERVRVVEGIPQGAILRDVRYVDHGMSMGELQLLVEHESFPELGEADSMWSTHTGEVHWQIETLSGNTIMMGDKIIEPEQLPASLVAAIDNAVANMQE